MRKINDRSKIFLKNKHAIAYLLKNGILSKERVCPKCQSIMHIRKRKAYILGYNFSCLNNLCRKAVTLFEGKMGESPRISIKDYFYMIYKWVEDNYEYDVIRNVGRAKKSYQTIKKKIYDFIGVNLKTDISKLSGVIQVDETAICKGKLFESPSNINDDFPGITWLVGFVETSSTEKRIKMEIISDRSEQTFKKLFEKYVEVGSTVITDGHRSYPGAIRSIQGTHIIVNHSIGFINDDGFTTNEIENLWMQIKYLIKKRKGVLKINIPVFLQEFKFRYFNLKKRNAKKISDVFKDIVRYIFTTKNK